MGALAQSSYLSGIIICVVALGIRLSPAAIGPGGALFTAPLFSHWRIILTMLYPKLNAPLPLH